MIGGTGVENLHYDCFRNRREAAVSSDRHEDAPESAIRDSKSWLYARPGLASDVGATQCFFCAMFVKRYNMSHDSTANMRVMNYLTKVSIGGIVYSRMLIFTF